MPGTLHHLIIRGIDRTGIFLDDRDRESFLERLSELPLGSRTPCYAWTLMGNHAHLLLRTGSVPIAAIMRRLLTGYPVRFNRRHRRHGPLFQKWAHAEAGRGGVRAPDAAAERRPGALGGGGGRLPAFGYCPRGADPFQQAKPDCGVRALIGSLATVELSVPGSEVARRFNQDRSAVSRAAARAGKDAEMRATAQALLREINIKADTVSHQPPMP